MRMKKKHSSSREDTNNLTTLYPTQYEIHFTLFPQKVPHIFIDKYNIITPCECQKEGFSPPQMFLITTLYLYPIWDLFHFVSSKGATYLHWQMQLLIHVHVKEGFSPNVLNLHILLNALFHLFPVILCMNLCCSSHTMANLLTKKVERFTCCKRVIK